MFPNFARKFKPFLAYQTGHLLSRVWWVLNLRFWNERHKVQNTLSSPNILFNVNKMFQITEIIKKAKSLNLVRYRHSSYNAVLLYRGIPSNVVFSKPKTALRFYLTKFFSKKKKKKILVEFFFFFQHLFFTSNVHFDNMIHFRLNW